MYENMYIYFITARFILLSMNCVWVINEMSLRRIDSKANGKEESFYFFKFFNNR